MTPAAAWHTVTSPFGVTVLVIWAGLAALILAANHAAHRKPPVPSAHINWMTHLPPVPPPLPWPNTRPPVDDADWLSIWPNVVDDDELCDAEFVSLINSNFHWPWPDAEAEA